MVCPGRNWLPCRSGSVYRTRSYRTDGRTETREKSGQVQCYKGNLEKTDVQEETPGAIGMQQQHKKPRPKRAITSGKLENTQHDLQVGDRDVNSHVFCQDSRNECQKNCWGAGHHPPKEGTAHSLSASHSQKKRRYACMPFGTNSLKKETM
jgi:hypothetical protein